MKNQTNPRSKAAKNALMAGAGSGCCGHLQAQSTQTKGLGPWEPLRGQMQYLAAPGGIGGQRGR